MTTNSIVDFELNGDPQTVQPHPRNARLHPDTQKAAMNESLDRVGWIGAVTANRRTGYLLDGHERREEAIARGETVPIIWVDIPEDDEAYVLATFDPIAALAEYDSSILAELLELADIETVDLTAMLTDQIAIFVGPPDVNDYNDDDYNPTLTGGDSDSEPEGSWLRLEVSDDLLERWRTHRSGFTSDDTALAAVLP